MEEPKEIKEKKKKEAAAARKKEKAAKAKKAKKKGGKVVSEATKSMITLTKGIGRAKGNKAEEKGTSEQNKPFDFGIAKVFGKDASKESSMKKIESGPKDNEAKPEVVVVSVTKPATVSPAKTNPNPVNVYKGAAERAQARTVVNTQRVLGSRTKYRGSRRFRVTFTTKAKRSYQAGDYDLSLAQQSEELRLTLVNILARAQATCKRAAIHPWVGGEDKEIPTIMNKALSDPKEIGSDK